MYFHLSKNLGWKIKKNNLIWNMKYDGKSILILNLNKKYWRHMNENTKKNIWNWIFKMVFITEILSQKHHFTYKYINNMLIRNHSKTRSIYDHTFNFFISSRLLIMILVNKWCQHLLWRISSIHSDEKINF